LIQRELLEKDWSDCRARCRKALESSSLVFQPRT